MKDLMKYIILNSYFSSKYNRRGFEVTLNDLSGNMPSFGTSGHIFSSWASEISCIILHILSGSGDLLFFFFLWCRDSIQRILSSQSFDTVKYLSDPNEGVILYVLSDCRRAQRLVCRNMMSGHKSAELAVLFFFLFFCKEIRVLPSGSPVCCSGECYLFLRNITTPNRMNLVTAAKLLTPPTL